MAIRKVALIGASGNLGPSVLAALLAAKLEVTVVVRASSKTTSFAGSPAVVTVPDDLPVSALTEALAGQEALVSTLPGSVLEGHLHLAEAAVAAGVRRFVPADFGSVDADDARAAELLPLYRRKREVRAYCEELAAKHHDFSWTAIVGGHFLDYGLKGGLLGIHLREGRATVFDNGECKWSATTLARLGDAVARVLTVAEDATRNRKILVQSVCVSQLDVVEAIINTSGRRMDVEFKRSDDYINEHKEKADEGDHAAIEEIVAVLGLTRSNWEGNPEFANKELGFEDENIDDVLKQVYMSYVPDYTK